MLLEILLTCTPREAKIPAKERQHVVLKIDPCRRWCGCPDIFKAVRKSKVFEQIVHLDGIDKQTILVAVVRLRSSEKRYTARDVLAYIDPRYRTIPQPHQPWPRRHSMGSYVASRIGMKPPIVFGRFYIMIPAACSKSPVVAELEYIGPL